MKLISMAAAGSWPAFVVASEVYGDADSARNASHAHTNLAPDGISNVNGIKQASEANGERTCSITRPLERKLGGFSSFVIGDCNLIFDFFNLRFVCNMPILDFSCVFASPFGPDTNL